MSPRDLERLPLFRRTVWKRNGYLLLTVVSQLLVLGFLACLRVESGATAEDGGPAAAYELLGYRVYFEMFSWGTLGRIAALLAVQVWLAHREFARALDGEGMVPLYPQDKSEGRRFGGLSGPEVVETVRQLTKDLGTAPVSRITVAVKPEPNAYTARMLGLGNVVVVHSNLLEVLPRDGVRSILAHEVAHIRRRDSLIAQTARAPTLFALVVAALAFLKIVGGLLDSDGVWQFLSRGTFLALGLALTVGAFALIGRVANLASQQAELIADAYAAQVCGWETHLNALLLIGERAEALTVLMGALSELPGAETELNQKTALRILNRFPPRELDEAVAREAAPRLFIQDRLDRLRADLCVPFTDDQIAELAESGALGLKRREDEQKAQDGKAAEAAPDAGRLTEWRNFDWDRSGHLDAAETAALVKELREDPRRMIYRQFLQSGAEWASHPSVRRRVLFLYDLFAARPQAAAMNH